MHGMFKHFDENMARLTRIVDHGDECDSRRESQEDYDYAPEYVLFSRLGRERFLPAGIECRTLHRLIYEFLPAPSVST
jgi:hypothetical protein